MTGLLRVLLLLAASGRTAVTSTPQWIRSDPTSCARLRGSAAIP